MTKELTPEEQRTAKFAIRHLSPREREVLEGIANGWTQISIAKKLGLAGKSVSTYKGRVLDKLDCRNDVELVHFALKYGIVGNLFDE